MPVVEFPALECRYRELSDHRCETGLKSRDFLFDGARAAAHLQDRAREEATTGKRATGEVVEEGVAHRNELPEPRWCGERWFDDLGLEDTGGFVDGGQLEVLLGAEVGIDAALAHVQGTGEVADRETFENLDRGESLGFADDGLPCSYAVGALLSIRWHLDKIARSV